MTCNANVHVVYVTRSYLAEMCRRLKENSGNAPRFMYFGDETTTEHVYVMMERPPSQ